MARSDLDRAALMKAVRHPSNFKPILFCSISLMAVASIMVIFGVVVVLLDSVELGPPHFDEQYTRYVGSSLPHIVGPMFIAFGCFTIMSCLVMIGLAYRSYSRVKTAASVNIRTISTKTPRSSRSDICPV